MIRLVRHRGLTHRGHPCTRLLFRLVPGEHLELECACGGRVRFSAADLRAFAVMLEQTATAESRPGAWELVPEAVAG